MKTYLVGGCVRDKHLGLTVKDRDWVVVGATPEHMLKAGYRQVGRDFPVFLHPQTHEEYALARTERKTGSGYTGFVVQAAPDVSLEADLRRRDLTINAIAESPEGTIIDPYQGMIDLQRRLLRHVSPAFVEDPVRILRVARFAARLAPLGFRVADETQALMRTMVDSGEIDTLVSERVWTELVRALGEEQPSVFFKVLRTCGALARLLPELDNLFGIPQPQQHHPEIDTGAHVMLSVDQAARLSPNPEVRFAALVHDVGKGLTPPEHWPRHIGHEAIGVPLVEALCTRLKAPRAFRELAVHVTRYHLHYHRAAELRADTTLDLFQSLDAFRRPERFEHFLLACEADARGRPGFEARDFDQPRILRARFQAAATIEARDLTAQGLSGTQIGAALRKARIAAITIQEHSS